MMTEQTSPEEPIFRYHRYGLTLEVFGNRVEVQERGGLLGMGGKKTAILFRNITDVKVEGFSKQLTIQTSGSTFKWQLGTDGERARQAILQRM